MKKILLFVLLIPVSLFAQDRVEKVSETQIRVVEPQPDKIRVIPLKILKQEKAILKEKLDKINAQIDEAVLLGVKEARPTPTPTN